MGWFSIDDQGNLIGDQPAEGIHYALEDYVRQGADKPSFSAFLRAIELSLQGHEADYLDVATASQWPIGKLQHAGGLRSSCAEEPARKLLAMASDLLLGIVQAYEMGVGRKPRLKEILGCIVFGLQGETLNLLTDATTLHLKKGDLVELR